MSDHIFTKGGIPREGEVRGVALQSQQKTHCDRGHPLSGDNLIIKVSGVGTKKRGCKACAKLYGEMAKGQARQARIKKKVGPPLYGCI